MRRATSLMMSQSGRTSPGGGRNGFCREIRRSEFVTVPDLSPQAAAGSRMSAWRDVSVCRITSETTTNSHRASAAATFAAAGMLLAGFVPMIHTAMTRRS